MVVEVKRKVVEKKGGKGRRQWPAAHPFWLVGQALASTLPYLSSFTTS
jgi:hypothetical protein